MSIPLLRSLALAAAAFGASSLSGPPSHITPRRDVTFVVHDSVLAQLTAVSDLALDPDGSLYLADFRFPAVLQLDSSGTLRRTIGRAGAGPGEFWSLFVLGLYRDSLWVVDPGQVRLTLFPRVGPGVTTIPFGVYAQPAQAGGRPQSRQGTPVSILPDGELLVQENVPVSNDPADGMSRTLLLRTDRELGVRDTLAQLSMRHSVMAFTYDDGETHIIQPFSDDPLYATSSDGTVLVTVSRVAAREPDDQEFKVTLRREGRGGVLERNISYRPELLPARVVDSVVRMLVHPRNYDGPPVPVTSDSVRRRLFRPRFYPPVEQVSVGRDGSVWLKVHFADGPERPGAADWLKLSTHGFPMLRVALPATFRLLEADGKDLYGVEGDPTEVPNLVRYIAER